MKINFIFFMSLLILLSCERRPTTLTVLDDDQNASKYHDITISPENSIMTQTVVLTEAKVGNLFYSSTSCKKSGYCHKCGPRLDYVKGYKTSGCGYAFHSDCGGTVKLERQRYIQQRQDFYFVSKSRTLMESMSGKQYPSKKYTSPVYKEEVITSRRIGSCR